MCVFSKLKPSSAAPTVTATGRLPGYYGASNLFLNVSEGWLWKDFAAAGSAEDERTLQ